MKELLQLLFLNSSVFKGDLPGNGVPILQDDFFQESRPLHLPPPGLP
jgi:hypothetical protein